MSIITIDSATVDLVANSSVSIYQINIVTRSGVAIPAEHITDAQKLDADGYVYLYQITLADRVTKIYQKPNNTVTWQGDTYEGVPIELTGVARHADDETSRPKLMLYNPLNVFSALVDRGLLEGGIVTRYKVLKTHLDLDLPLYRREQWKLSRVASVKRNFIACELRDMLDGQIFSTPPRMYIPPDFPAVSLT